MNLDVLGPTDELVGEALASIITPVLDPTAPRCPLLSTRAEVGATSDARPDRAYMAIAEGRRHLADTGLPFRKPKDAVV